MYSFGMVSIDLFKEYVPVAGDAGTAAEPRRPEALHPSLWLAHQLGRNGARAVAERLRSPRPQAC